MDPAHSEFLYHPLGSYLPVCLTTSGYGSSLALSVLLDLLEDLILGYATPLIEKHAQKAIRVCELLVALSELKNG